MTDSAPARQFRVDVDLLILSAAVVFINLPYFGGEFLPGHDTRTPFTMFSYFYNHLSVTHEVPLWLAYGTFGLKSAAFQACYLSVSSTLSMAAGVLFGVGDSLTLFVISVIGEQLLFLLGVYLLSKRLFADRLTVFIIGFAAVCSTVWYWQIFFNFRIYYHLPLALYFLFRFTEEKRPEFFWLTGLTVLLGTLGSPLYFYPLHALTLVLAAAGLGRTFLRALPCLIERSWKNGLSLGVLILAGAALGLTLSQALTGIRIDATGRDPASGRALLENFLTYGGVTTPQILGSFLGVTSPFGVGADRELTHYVGLFPMLALVVALARCRSPYFFSLVIAAGGLLLFSLGGTFAALAYRFPLLSLYRHVGCVTTVSKVLLLLASGFGIQPMLASLSQGIALERRTRFALLALTVGVLWFVLDLQLGGENLRQLLRAADQGDVFSSPFATAATAGARILFWVAAAAALLWPSRLNPRVSALAWPSARQTLLVALVMDGLLFQGQIVSETPKTHQRTAFPVGTLAYRERRDEVLDPDTARRLEQWRVAGFRGMDYHLTTCAIFQIDAIRPLQGPPKEARIADGWASEGVALLVESRAQIKPDPELPIVLGSGAPKLRLVSSAVVVDSVEEAKNYLSQARSLDRRALLRKVSKDQGFSAPSDAGPVKGSVSVKSFSANELVAEVAVAQENPVWLIYADSFHPGWQATVNGKPVPIAEAYLAFKGVRLEKGTSLVRFYFHDGIRTVAQKVLALLVTLGGATAFAGLLVTIFPINKKMA